METADGLAKQAIATTFFFTNPDNSGINQGIPLQTGVRGLQGMEPVPMRCRILPTALLTCTLDLAASGSSFWGFIPAEAR